MLGLPVAVLDYGNTPHYVQPAWRITAWEHMPEVLAELLNPTPAKMLFQETTLHDALECSTPATPRLIEVIGKMMQEAREAKQQGRAVRFPQRILKAEKFHIRENRFQFEALYRDHPLLRQNSPTDKAAERRSRNIFTDAPAKPSLPLNGKIHPAFSKTPGAGPAALFESAGGAPTKRKILFISHDASRTGAPLFLISLIRWFRENDIWDVRIVLRAGGVLEPEFRELGETILCANIEPGSPALADVSLIYSNTCTNGLFLRNLPDGAIPVVTHVHELQYTIESFGRENFEEVRRHTSHFIACSEAVSEGLHERYHIATEQITVIHEGISAKKVIEGAAARTVRETKLACGLREDDAVVAACGFAGLRKGPDLFVQIANSMRRLAGTQRRVSFLWIGQSPEDERGRILLHDVEQLGLTDLVKFVGEQQNPYALLNACDVFCLCSREDPFPLVMLEAGALGKPTVCFERAGGAEEFCGKGGGFKVAYLDVQAMGQRIINLIDNEELRRTTGEAAARLVREEFDLGVIAPKILQLIEPFSRLPQVIIPPVPVVKRNGLRRIGNSIAELFGSRRNGV